MPVRRPPPPHLVLSQTHYCRFANVTPVLSGGPSFSVLPARPASSARATDLAPRKPCRAAAAALCLSLVVLPGRRPITIYQARKLGLWEGPRNIPGLAAQAPTLAAASGPCHYRGWTWLPRVPLPWSRGTGRVRPSRTEPHDRLRHALPGDTPWLPQPVRLGRT